MSFAYSFILMGLTETEYIFWPLYFNGVDRNIIHLLAFSFILMGLTETEYVFWPTVLF